MRGKDPGLLVSILRYIAKSQGMYSNLLSKRKTVAVENNVLTFMCLLQLGILLHEHDRVKWYVCN